MAKVRILKRAGKYRVGETHNDIPKDYEKYLLDNGYAKAITKAPKNKAITKVPKNKAQDFIGHKDMK